MSNYTEKTSGAQIKKMLTMLFGEEAKELKVSYDNGNIGFRVDNLPSIGEVAEVLDTCKINPRFVVIDETCGHLKIVVCNHDGTDIEIED